jgi:putative nucleotidyltransferase with HDIG domain
MRKQILIVGRQPELEKEFRTYSLDPGGTWAAVPAATVPEALHLLAHENFDAVVAQADSGGFRGVALLDEIMRRHPHLLRMVISDPTDIRGTVGCIGKGHYHLLKPCSLACLLEALERPYGSDNWRPNEAAQNLIVQMQHLPSPPKIYFQILTALQSPDVWIERIGELISQDPAVTAKVLQLANSAMFGRQVRVTHPRDAVAYVGLETTKALVLLAHTFSSFGRFEVHGFSAEELWRHSVVTGRFAKRIARLEKQESGLQEQAFTAGLLHDVGKLLLAANLPERFNQVIKRAADEGRELSEIETASLGTSHAELGACLLGTWGLPGAIVQAVALHHSPNQSAEPSFNGLTAVHAANVIAHESWPNPLMLPLAQIDRHYLEQLGLQSRVPFWRENCLTSEPKETR